MAKHNPCPFCESGNVTALGFYRSDGLWWVVECQNCHAYGSRAATYGSGVGVLGFLCAQEPGGRSQSDGYGVGGELTMSCAKGGGDD